MHNIENMGGEILTLQEKKGGRGGFEGKNGKRCCHPRFIFNKINLVI